ncbi:MAG: hypothetical protein ACXWCO_00775 [Caldimonas sp.]
MNKPAIPLPDFRGERRTYRVLAALKENVEAITGAKGGAVQTLDSTATLAEVIATLNALIAQVSA